MLDERAAQENPPWILKNRQRAFPKVGLAVVGSNQNTGIKKGPNEPFGHSTSAPPFGNLTFKFTTVQQLSSRGGMLFSQFAKHSPQFGNVLP